MFKIFKTSIRISMPSPSHILLIIMVLFSLGIINFITYITYQQMQDLKAENQRVMQSYDIIETSESLFSNLLLIGNYGRAFLLTGFEDFFKGMNINKSKALKDLALLKNLSKNDIEQQNYIKEFELILMERIDMLDAMVQLKIKNAMNEKLLRDELKKSSVLVDRLNELHLLINEEEVKTLNERTDVVFKRSETIEFYTLFSSIVSFVILATGAALLSNQFTKRKEAEDKLAHLAYHDVLTGLVNRTYLEKRIQEAIQVCERYSQKMALIFIDIDNFKLINDKYGHDAGDFVLQILAKRLLENVRNIDTVCRLGGDEFIVILSGVHKKLDVDIAVDKMIRLMGEVIEYQEERFWITVSMGVSFYPDDGQDSGSLLKRSDIAMYRAKERNGSSLQYYN